MQSENAVPEQGESRPGQWPPGVSGNPAGKPKGTRNRATRLLDAIGDDGAEAVLRKVLKMAEAGDMAAARIVLDRVWPATKGRSVTLGLPAMHTAADLVPAIAAVAEAMARGEVTPDEAATVAGVLEIQRRTIETADHAERIAALEAQAPDGTGAR